LPAGPAALAERTGAALVPVSMWYEGGRMRVDIQQEIAVPAEGGRSERVQTMTARLARVFQGAIAEHPRDWHMLQRVFAADLDTGEQGERGGTVKASPAAPRVPAPRRGRTASRRRTRR
ncbi:phosphatidylinositol mannoside acyltransferase, partial [Streptomonospora algeriensis]